MGLPAGMALPVVPFPLGSPVGLPAVAVRPPAALQTLALPTLSMKAEAALALAARGAVAAEDLATLPVAMRQMPALANRAAALEAIWLASSNVLSESPEIHSRR
mmetsp:Transcript_23933/g.26564  ORF Transcript_23933/g.26564 Transcript_23933/m.26564 type:complete len:104 (-) Transcript_23933:53-364(-)